MDVIIRIGGSVIASPIRADLIKEYVSVIGEFLKGGNRVGLVVGGGETARKYIKVAAELGFPDRKKDMYAIYISRLNASLFSESLTGNSSVARTIGVAARAFKAWGFVAMGGLRPGMTTDFVALELAKAVASPLLIKATDQEGIYDADPRTHPGARLLPRLTYEQLSLVVESASHTPGLHSILDPLTVKGLKGSGIRVIVFNGNDPENLRKVLSGYVVGSVVEPG
ncbi:MAG: UMP kinase [Candidatus Marsarchaeota archaeon]